MFVLVPADTQIIDSAVCHGTAEARFRVVCVLRDLRACFLVRTRARTQLTDLRRVQWPNTSAARPQQV